jgi:hypothetical protein
MDQVRRSISDGGHEMITRCSNIGRNPAREFDTAGEQQRRDAAGRGAQRCGISESRKRRPMASHLEAACAIGEGEELRPLSAADVTSPSRRDQASVTTMYDQGRVASAFAARSDALIEPSTDSDCGKHQNGGKDKVAGLRD